MMAGIKLYWSSIDTLIASVIATAGIGLVHHVHPGLHPLAYAAGWLALASVLHQSSELSEAQAKSHTASSIQQ